MTRHEFLTTGELAEKMNVHPCSVRRWIEDGKVRVVRTPGGPKRPGSYRIPVAEAERLLAGEPQ